MKTTTATKGFEVRIGTKVVSRYLFSDKGTRALYSEYYANLRCKALCAAGYAA